MRTAKQTTLSHLCGSVYSCGLIIVSSWNGGVWSQSKFPLPQLEMWRHNVYAGSELFCCEGLFLLLKSLIKTVYNVVTKCIKCFAIFTARTLGYWSEGQGFKPQYQHAASVVPLIKILICKYRHLHNLLCINLILFFPLLFVQLFIGMQLGWFNQYDSCERLRPFCAL